MRRLTLALTLLAAGFLGACDRAPTPTAPTGILLSASRGTNGSDAALEWSTTSPFDYGTIDPGSASPVTFTLTNTGGRSSGTVMISLSGSSFSITGDDCTGTGLAPKATCTVAVAFAPTEAGPFTGKLTANAEHGSASLDLTGQGSAPEMEWSLKSSTISSYDYGSVNPGSSPTETFTLTNAGGWPSGAVTVSLTSSSAFSITADGCTGKDLVPNATCTVTVEFAPTEAGTVTATLTGGTATLDLTGSSVVTNNGTINFIVTNGGPAPTGSFVYDRTTKSFTSFTVNWDGVQYDYGSYFNSRGKVAGVDPLSLLLISGIWCAAASPDETSFPCPIDSFVLGGDEITPDPTYTDPSATANGTYTVTLTAGTINFIVTSGGPAPTGSYVYDVTTKSFTSFTVNWDGVQYDYGSYFNSRGRVAGVDPLSLLLISGIWCAAASPDETSFPCPIDSFVLGGDEITPDPTYTDPSATASGTYTVTPTP